MKAYVIALIACGSVAAVILVWYFSGRMKNHVPAPAPAPRDVEKAAVTSSTHARRDWGIRGLGGGGMSSWGGGAISVSISI